MTSPAFEVEPATIEDLDVLTSLWVELVDGQQTFGSHIEAEPNRSTGRDVLGQYITGDMVAVARAGGGSEEGEVGEEPSTPPLLGFVMYHLEQGLYGQRVTRGIVENLYVIPEARETGVGSALMDAAESTLLDRGAEVIALSVMAENEIGREFYEARGYEPHRIVYERDVR